MHKNGFGKSKAWNRSWQSRCNTSFSLLQHCVCSKSDRTRMRKEDGETTNQKQANQQTGKYQMRNRSQHSVCYADKWLPTALICPQQQIYPPLQIRHTPSPHRSRFSSLIKIKIRNSSHLQSWLFLSAKNAFIARQLAAQQNKSSDQMGNPLPQG